MPPYDVFISYAREDKLTARLVRGYFRSHNIHSWFDDAEFAFDNEPDDKKIEADIETAIRGSKFFLVLMSKSAVDNRWVQKEVELAKKLRDRQRRTGDPPLGIICLLLDDPIDHTALPDWMKGVKLFEVSGRFRDVDRLKELRDEIGKVKSTYIGAVEPNFIKQISLSALTEDIVKCRGTEYSMWYINGGYSLAIFIEPALREVLRRQRNEHFHFSELFTTNYKLKRRAGSKPKKPLADTKRNFDERLYRKLIESNFISDTLPHDEHIFRAAALFEDVRSEFDNFTFEIRLTNKIPPGRLLFVSDIGFYGPYMGRANAQAPMFVFDNKSPFYVTSKESFDESFAQGKTYWNR